VSIEHLQENVKLPFDAEAIRDPALREYLYKLVKELERERFQAIHQTVNLLLDIQQVGWQYFSLPDPTTGEYADGSIRIGVNDSGFEVQKKVDGVWTKLLRQA